MNHINKIIDADPHFTIDPISRRIRNESSKKVTLIQGDHNSERFSFELPRFVEGHDMLECNRVEVHFINIENNTGNRHEDMYDVKDMQTHPDNPDHVAFSWLITDNATKYVGSLAFGIRFCCTDTDNVADYVWKTAVNKDIKISEGMNTAESVDEAIPDIIAQWEERIFGEVGDAVENINTAKTEALKEINDVLEEGKETFATKEELNQEKFIRCDYEDIDSIITAGKYIVSVPDEKLPVRGDAYLFVSDVCANNKQFHQILIGANGTITKRSGNISVSLDGVTKTIWSEWQTYATKEEIANTGGGDISVGNNIAIWKSNTAYEVGDVVLILNPFLGATIIGTCKLSHTSSHLSNLMENIDSYWDYEEINANKASSAMYDDEGRLIRTTYATKKEIGDIETSLENIIAKYGLGGDAS